jgi:TPR repeat protein
MPMPRFPRFGLAVATTFTLLLSAPLAAQSIVTSTYGNLSVTITGNGSLGSRQGTSGIEARLNDHLVIIGPDSIMIDGEAFAVAAQSTVVISGIDGFSVTVDGTEIGVSSEIEQLMADAAAGVPEAQNNLGNRYFNGNGVEQDYQRASELYLLAANAGVPEAQSNLAYSYWNGEGVESDDDEAMRLAQLAADQGNAIGMRLVALGYFHGRGFVQDRAQAAQLWAEAANLGDAVSAYNMGIIVRDGDGVLADDALAILWFQRAEELGHAQAGERLGEMGATQ